ncbi:MAG: methyltransferase domain-containing protein [Clostridia bacterium]|nr:methyltransferase domain-containing protein [Clostridia bacterium]
METLERLGRYTLRQSDECFKLGGDSLALGGFATVRRGWKVCDLGCGTGALLLLLAEREDGLDLMGVELDGAAASLAQRNLDGNGLHGQVVCRDLRRRSHPEAGRFDLVVSNPPWFAEGRGRPGGTARCEEACTLSEVCASAGYLLKNGGRFAMVHRPERLAEVFAALHGCGMEPKRLQMIQHRLASAPSAALVEAVKQGRPGLEVLPVLLLAP